MHSLKKYILEAEKNKIAIGHFNVSNIEILHAIYNSARELKLPVIIGVSEGEEKFIGLNEISSLIKTYKQKDNYPIFLNADHHYTFESVKSAIIAGFDSVIIDAADKPLSENIEFTKKCVEFAHEVEKNENREILVEAEIGFIGKSSTVLDEIPFGVSSETMTNPEDAKFFVDETGVDLLAPSVGNIHGIIKGGNPKLDLERIRDIKDLCKVPLVLHGGSGLSDEDFLEAINAGISIIHINTEIRVAYKNALEQSLNDQKNEFAPYKYLKPAISAVENVVLSRLKLFNKID
jgi:fructose-bisphosphate aldolase, class II